MKKIISTILMLMVTMQLFAQGEGSAVADTLAGSEKIYVVVVCVTIILLGMIALLFSIERRVKKLEKKSRG